MLAVHIRFHLNGEYTIYTFVYIYIYIYPLTIHMRFAMFAGRFMYLFSYENWGVRILCTFAAYYMDDTLILYGSMIWHSAVGMRSIVYNRLDCRRRPTDRQPVTPCMFNDCICTNTMLWQTRHLRCESTKTKGKQLHFMGCQSRDINNGLTDRYTSVNGAHTTVVHWQLTTV